MTHALISQRVLHSLFASLLRHSPALRAMRGRLVARDAAECSVEAGPPAHAPACCASRGSGRCRRGCRCAHGGRPAVRCRRPVPSGAPARCCGVRDPLVARDGRAEMDANIGTGDPTLDARRVPENNTAVRARVRGRSLRVMSRRRRAGLPTASLLREHASAVLRVRVHIAKHSQHGNECGCDAASAACIEQ